MDEFNEDSDFRPQTEFYKRYIAQKKAKKDPTLRLLLKIIKYSVAAMLLLLIIILFITHALVGMDLCKTGKKFIKDNSGQTGIRTILRK